MILTRALPDNPLVEATGNPYLKTTAGDAFSAGMGTDTLGDLLSRQAAIRDANTRVEVVREQNGMTTLREVEREDQVSADELNAQYPDVGFDRPMTAEAAKIIADARRAQQIREDIMSRAPLTGAGIAGSLVAMATDPLEVASAFVPVVGPAGRAVMVGRLGRIGGRIAEGVVEGAVGNALTEPLYYGLSRSQHLDYDMADSLMNVGLGGALGGVLGTAAAVAGRAAPRERMVAPEAAQRGSESIAFDPRAGLTPPEKMAALRTSVAQMATGRRVDVPVPMRPRTTLEALSEIGVRDDGGDLAAMGVSDWDRGRAFKRNVVREDGMGRDQAARWLWENGYLRDQPEAQQMRVAERREGPEPDLIAAMDRVIDEELTGSPRFAEGDEARASRWRSGVATQEQVARRAEVREMLGPRGEGLRDRLIDDVIARVDRGDTPDDALAGALGMNARQADPYDEEIPGWSDADLDRIDAARATDTEFDEESAMLDARIDDFKMRGILSDEDVAAILEMDVIINKARAAGEVARAAAACLISAPF